MKTGINAWSIKTDADFEEAFSHAKAAGFDGIELNVDANNAGHSLTFGTTDAELDEIMAISEKHNLPVSSISTSLWAGKMGQGTAESMKFCEKLLETQLRFAKHLGARGILTVPGGMTDEISLDRSYKNSVKALKELTPLAEEYAKSGITTGVENVWNAFFTSAPIGNSTIVALASSMETP